MARIFDDHLEHLLGPAHLRELADLERQYREIAIPEAFTDPGMRLADEANRAAQEIQDIAREFAPSPAAELQRTVADEVRRLTDGLAAQVAGISGDFFNSAARAGAESASDHIAAQLEEAFHSLPLGPFGETVQDLIDEQLRIPQDKLVEQVQGSMVDLLDTLLGAYGFSSWTDEIVRAVQHPDLTNEASRLFQSVDDQARLAEELLAQSGWRELAEMAARGAVPDAAHNNPRRRRLVLLRQFTKACKQIGRTSYERLSREAKRAELGRWFIALAFSIHSNQMQSVRLSQIERKVDGLPAEIEATTRDQSWTLLGGRTLTLHIQPLRHAPDRLEVIGNARVIELRRSDSWIKVEVWDCDGNRHTGWIRAQDTEQLVPGDREICESRNEPPTLLVEAGPRAVDVWKAFFANEIENAHTREAYRRACRGLLDYCYADGLALADITAAHVADWRDALAADKSASTVRQSLTAVRRLFDTFVVREVLPVNPAHPVRSPRLTGPVTVTPSLRPAELVALFDSFDPDRLPDLRDRALIAVMSFSLARADAVATLQVGDVDLSDSVPQIWLREKRDPDHTLPLDPAVAGWIRDYVATAGIEDLPDTPLFRSFGRGRGHNSVMGHGLSRQDIYTVVRQRFEQAGIKTRGGCHVLRATGITLLLAWDVPIDLVSRLAGHTSVDMTRRYDSRSWSKMREALRRLTRDGKT